MENSLTGDVSKRVDLFNQNFLCMLNKHAPVKKVKIKHRQCPFVDYKPGGFSWASSPWQLVDEQLKQHESQRSVA